MDAAQGLAMWEALAFTYFATLARVEHEAPALARLEQIQRAAFYFQVLGFSATIGQVIPDGYHIRICAPSGQGVLVAIGECATAV